MYEKKANDLEREQNESTYASRSGLEPHDGVKVYEIPENNAQHGDLHSDDRYSSKTDFFAGPSVY